MADMKVLYDVAEDVLSAARRRFLPLEPVAGRNLLQEGGWDATTDGDSFNASRIDDETQTHAFMTVQQFNTPPINLFCLIREFDLGRLAGELREYKLLEATPSEARVEYVSVLPWPFEPRWIQATLRFGVVRETGALVILGESVPGATSPPSGATLGTVHYSFYHIAPAEETGQSVMRRIINVDMHLPLPGFVVRKSLESHYQTDLGFIEEDVAKWDGSQLQQRLREREYYRVIERALAGAGPGGQRALAG